MRFVRQVARADQLSDFGGSLVAQRFLPSNPAYNHLYTYAVNSPLRYIDPLGLLCSDPNYWKCMGWTTLCTNVILPCVMCNALPPPYNVYCLGGCAIGLIGICVQEVDKMCTAQFCPPAVSQACLKPPTNG
jgi:hypothetical protein